MELSWAKLSNSWHKFIRNMNLMGSFTCLDWALLYNSWLHLSWLGLIVIWLCTPFYNFWWVEVQLNEIKAITRLGYTYYIYIGLITTSVQLTLELGLSLAIKIQAYPSLILFIILKFLKISNIEYRMQIDLLTISSLIIKKTIGKLELNKASMD